MPVALECCTFGTLFLVLFWLMNCTPSGGVSQARCQGHCYRNPPGYEFEAGLLFNLPSDYEAVLCGNRPPSELQFFWTTFVFPTTPPTAPSATSFLPHLFFFIHLVHWLCDPSPLLSPCLHCLSPPIFSLWSPLVPIFMTISCVAAHLFTQYLTEFAQSHSSIILIPYKAAAKNFFSIVSLPHYKFPCTRFPPLISALYTHPGFCGALPSSSAIQAPAFYSLIFLLHPLLVPLVALPKALLTLVQPQ